MTAVSKKESTSKLEVTNSGMPKALSAHKVVKPDRIDGFRHESGGVRLMNNYISSSNQFAYGLKPAMQVSVIFC